MNQKVSILKDFRMMGMKKLMIKAVYREALLLSKMEQLTQDNG
jgi:hypothetical protein